MRKLTKIGPRERPQHQTNEPTYRNCCNITTHINFPMIERKPLAKIGQTKETTYSNGFHH
jgi:hypothetical protein